MLVLFFVIVHFVRNTVACEYSRLSFERGGSVRRLVMLPFEIAQSRNAKSKQQNINNKKQNSRNETFSILLSYKIILEIIL